MIRHGASTGMRRAARTANGRSSTPRSRRRRGVAHEGQSRALGPLGPRIVAAVIGAPVLFVGVALTIHSGLGPGSWQVFELGLAAASGWPLGTVMVVESVVAVLLAWWLLWQPPGPMTVVMAFTGGPAIQWLLGVLPAVAGPPAQVVTALVGIGVLAGGLSLYLAAELGASAQDSLFVGVYRRWRLRPGNVRFVMDASLVALGWLLGGLVGVGTLLITFGIPPIIDALLPWFQARLGTSEPPT